MMNSLLWEGYRWDTSVWDRLKTCGKPIALYGMGLGAEKILQAFDAYGIHPSAVFASDGFVRGHSFHGFSVLDYETLCKKFSDCIVVISFASQRPEVLEQMKRVSEQFETVAPDVPVAGELLFTPALLENRRPKWEAAYSLLADDQSRFVFREVLQFKLTGRIEHLFRCATPRQKIWDLFPLRADEFLVDMGAYTGDTIKEFLEQNNFQCRKILALEPDSRSFRKLSLYAQVLRDKYGLDIQCENLGAWNQREQLMFQRQAGRNSALSQFTASGLEHRKVKEIPVEMDSLDHILEQEPLSPTLLKLDVEGAEEIALQGCRETIPRCRPQLMVSVYHRSDDLFRLPLYLHSLNPDYRFYLRHHPYIPAWETNFYVV